MDAAAVLPTHFDAFSPKNNGEHRVAVSKSHAPEGMYVHKGAFSGRSSIVTNDVLKAASTQTANAEFGSKVRDLLDLCNGANQTATIVNSKTGLRADLRDYITNISHHNPEALTEAANTLNGYLKATTGQEQIEVMMLIRDAKSMMKQEEVSQFASPFKETLADFIINSKLDEGLRSEAILLANHLGLLEKLSANLTYAIQNFTYTGNNRLPQTLMGVAHITENPQASVATILAKAKSNHLLMVATQILKQMNPIEPGPMLARKSN